MPVNRFPSDQEAKEFVVAKIVEEAQREGVPLSEVERKMLYFSETDWTLPDIMEVSDEFDKEYDQKDYEKKIAGLIRGLVRRIRRDNREEYDLWLDAIGVLSLGDHYVLVMVKQAGALPRPRHDLLRLWMTGLALVGTFMAWFIGGSMLLNRFHINVGDSDDQFRFLTWAALIVLMVACVVLYFAVGRKRASRLLAQTFSFVFGIRIPDKDRPRNEGSL